MNQIREKAYSKVNTTQKSEYKHSGTAAKGALVAVSLMTFVYEVLDFLKMDDDD